MSVTGRLRTALACGAAAVVLMAAADPAHADLVRRFAAAKHAPPAKPKTAAPKPLGLPLITVSIASQRLTLYDNGEPVAHAPVSTGMAGHSTPMGVFSVIQKEVFHRSNIYSGAPMPYMQRITWSGVAMHAGVLPGYPASHGCIRMPYDFAVKLYGLTRSGARVVITRNEIAPAPFEHPRLFALPPPATDKISQQTEPAVPAAKPPVRTADSQTTTVMSDAVGPAGQALEGLPKSKPAEASVAEPPVAETPRAPEAPAVAETPNSSTRQGEPESARVDAGDAAKLATSPQAEPQGPNQTAAETAIQAARPVAETGADVDAKPAEVSTGTVLVTPVPVVAAQPIELPKTFEPAIALPKPVPLAESYAVPYGPERPLRPGPITVFVSKKEGKVFVRKAFQPVFNSPVTIVRPDLPLGTHVFMASEPKPDGMSFRWLEMSVPDESAKKIEARAQLTAAKNRRVEKPVVAAAMVPPATAAEALDRIEIPPTALARISALMSRGATLIVSDEGLGGETGTETDFIVLTR
ncbi:MAG TPA: L,D-transpeptidase family protein [Xanthobacteraceae bacterium]